MWYLVKKNRNDQREVIGFSVLGKSDNVFATKTDHENVWHEGEIDHELLGVVVDENGAAVLDEMNNMQLEQDEGAVSIAAQEAEIALRIRRIAFGQRLVAIMSIRNDAKDLSPSEIVELVATFQTVNTAWLNGSIATSRAIIDAIEPDEVLITTADKAAILAEIDANLEVLGY